VSDGAAPVTRPGDPKAHLLADHELWALCGRPAGAGGSWTRLQQQPDRKDRCRDCEVAGKNLPHRPSVPIYPWRT
jgi:hypothetical protein